MELKDPAFIIGNGPSRAVLNLLPLLEKGTVYGCNALYRDFAPHYLVAVDKNMQIEIHDAGYHLEHKCLFRSQRSAGPYSHENITYWVSPGGRNPNNSGVSALYFALKHRHKDVYLIGLDFNTARNQANIYQDTRNYLKQSIKPPKLRNDVLNKIDEWTTRNSHLVKFTRVVSEFSNIPDLKGFKEPHMSHISYEEFVARFGEELWKT